MRTPSLGKHISLKEFSILLSIVILVATAGIIHHNTVKPNLVISKQDASLNVNKDLLLMLSLGNKRMIADLLWVQTLLESDFDHYEKGDLRNWMYLRFRSIASLDPYFYENYSWGGQYLTIIKDDLEGGLDLIEEGIKIFPDDYQLNYLAGFSYYYELGNYEKGIKYLSKIVNYPQAPHFLPALIMKMKVEQGFSFDTAIDLVRSQLEQVKDERMKDKLKKDFYALKAERDLTCLNGPNKGCDLFDAEGKPYYRRNERYYSETFFYRYRLYRKGSKSSPKLINTL